MGDAGMCYLFFNLPKGAYAASKVHDEAIDFSQA